jgi:hypothetical protein
MALGGEGLGFSTGAIRSEPLGIVDLDALIAYLRSFRSRCAHRRSRIVLSNAAP